MITKSEAIVLRIVDFSESSIIATVLSREHGKIGLMAKGARRPKSRFSGMMQPGNLLEVVYGFKSARTLQTLREASYAVRMDRLNRDMEKMALSMSALELIGQLLHDGEVNLPVYDFTRRFLIWLEQTDEATPATFPYLQIRLAGLIGLELQIEEAIAGQNEGYLNVEAGIISHRPLTSGAVRLTLRQLEFLVNASGSRKVSTLRAALDSGELRSLVDQLDRYFNYHLDGLRPRRSDAIYDQILNR